MSKKLLALAFFLCLGKIYSQQIQVEILNSETSEAIENATILTAANGVVAVSDANGKFSFSPEAYPLRLEVSALGFKNREFFLKKYRPEIFISMEPSTEALSEVVLRSTLIPNSLRRIPASVNLISETDLQRTDPTNLVQNFNYVPGVYVNQGALNTNKINIRGIGARSQYSTNRIQAYFDGIPLTTAEGELTLDDIDQESLERIEIIKGPTSSIYGAGLGGSINLYSAEPKGEVAKARISSDFGSYDLLKNSVRTSYSSGNSSFFANYAHLQSDGYRDNGDYDRKSLLLNGRLAASEKNSLSFLANFTKLKAYIPSSLNEEDFLYDPESAAQNWAAAEGYESYDRGLMGISYSHNFSEKFRNESSIFLNFRNGYEPRPFDILKEEGLSIGARTKFGLNFPIFEFPSELSFGAEYYREWYEIGTFQNLYEENPGEGSIRGERLSNNEQDRKYANFFAQMNLELNENWFLETGFNLNTTSYALTDLYAEDETDRTGDYRFKTIFSPRIGTSYELAEGKNIYGSLSHGFSTPTVAETLTPQGQINTQLEPETGINYEIGFKGNWLQKRLYTEVSVYSIQIDNLLVAERIAEDQYVGVNAGKTDHNGVEFLVRYNFQLFPSVTANPYFNAAINFFEFDEFVNEGVDNSGNELPGVPKSTVNLGFDLKSNWGLSFFSNFRGVGEMPLNDENSAYTNNYSLVNLKAQYELNLLQELQLRFTAGVNNFFDEHYAASIVTNAVGFGGATPRYYYPGNPRNYYGGLGLNYNF